MSLETNTKDHLNLLKRNIGTLKKAVIAILLLSTLTVSVGFAQETDKQAVYNKIYHVYADNEYIGYVSDEQEVNKLIEQKQQEASIQYEELSIDAGSNISLIPEQIYYVEAKDDETLMKLQQSIAIEADAYAVEIDGETIAYLKDVQAYEDVINQLKLQYVSKEQLDELNARQFSTEPLPPLAEDETRILDVSLTKDVAGEVVKVNPSDIKTSAQVLELLKTGSTEKQIYIVQQGDILGLIASKYGLTIAELLALNKGLTETSIINIGQQLNVTVPQSLVSVKVVKESNKVETIAYTKVTEEDATMLKGESKVKQDGADGKKQVTFVETMENGVKTSTSTTNEKTLQAPVDEIIVEGTKVIPSRGTGSFVWPTNGGYISSQMGPRWGSYHRGIDIARPSNYTIKAADNGIVTAAGWSGTYGYRIVVNHNNGYQTLYAHLSQIDVQVGQIVAQGSGIGVMGSTGNSTGTHLHFEVEENGTLVNPVLYLP